MAWWAIAGSIMAATGLGGQARAAGVDPASSTVEATGRQSVVLTVDAFGRYAIEAQSRQGTAVQLVDRMAGPGPRRGTPGQENGRVDAFLEEGQTKVWLHSASEGTGQASLRVRRFTEQNPSYARLEHGAPVATELEDLQQRSFWVEVTSEEAPVALEAVGRWLGDLRLWRDGSWLVDAAPRCDVVTPAPGQPQRRCQLFAQVPPGLYLATAYGGPAEPWSEGDDARAPLTLMRGMPSLPSAGRRTARVGPMGFDRYLVPAEPNVVHVALSEHADVRVEVAARRTPQHSPYQAARHVAAVTPESRVPAATVRRPAGDVAVVTVWGPVGQPYTMSWFPGTTGAVPIQGDGKTSFVSTLHAAPVGDEIDPTALLWHRTSKGAVLDANQAVDVSRDHPFERRFNLPESSQVLFHVGTEGSYTVQLEGVDAKFAIDPLLINPPADYEPTPLVNGQLQVDLGVGLHVLRLVPKEPGIAILRVAHSSARNWLRRAFGKAPAATPLRPAIQWPAVRLAHRTTYQLAITTTSAHPMGLVVRPLPLDIEQGLPFTLLPGESITVPIKPTRARAMATQSDGTPLPVRTEGTSVTITNPTSAPVAATLHPEPIPLERPLPVLTAEQREQLPEFDRIRLRAPASLSLGRTASRTYLLEVEDDGLYRVQSTGLLHTSGAVRTRLRTGFAEGKGNGAGRNFLVADYLRSGTYQVTVQTQGSTEGALGMRLDRTPIIDGGALRPGVPARVTLDAGQGVSYQFTLDEPGQVRVRSEGQNRDFRCRFVDQDDWPVVKPNVPCNRTLKLPAGTYRVLGMPVEVGHRRITSFERVDLGTVSREGHGPHVLPFGQSASHVWREPADPDVERVPDQWLLDVPAPVRATVALDEQMTGDLLRDGQAVARLVPGERWTGPLEAGRYELRIRGARRSTGVRYQLAVTSDELVVGTSKGVGVPGRVRVSVGTQGVVRFGSRGRVDVRARLYDADGRLLVTNDDRPDDWNFQLTTRLRPGIHTLLVDGAGAGTSQVWMEAPQERTLDPLSPNTTRTVATDEGGAAMSVSVPRGREVLVVEAQATENIGIGLEHQVDDAWVGLGTATGRTPVLVARLADPAHPVRLRVWSEDGRGGDLSVQVRALAARRSPGSGWSAVRASDAGGLFDLGSDREGLYACVRRGVPCAPAPRRVVGASDEGLVLVRRSGRVRVRRARLAAGTPRTVAVRHSAQWVDLAGGIAPTVLQARSTVDSVGVALEGSPLVAVSARGTMALAPGGARRGAVWDAARRPTPHDAKLTAASLARVDGNAVGPGRHELSIPAGAMLALPLPDTPHDLQVALEAGTSVAGSPGLGLWADEVGLTGWLPQHRGTLWLFNPTAEARLAVVSVLRAGTVPPELSLAAPVEWLAATAGQRVVQVPAAEGRVRVRGPATATLVRSDGTLARGTDLAVGPGGWLVLAHGVGPVLVQVEPPGEPVPPTAGPSLALGSGGTVALEGALATLTLGHSAPAVAHLVVPCPAVAHVTVGERTRAVVLDQGAPLDVWMPAGQATVTLRALAGTALFGQVPMTVSEPVPLTEGQGPEVLLPSGGSRWFTFQVEEERFVGVGVDARADRVHTQVVSEHGDVVAEGLVRKVSLPSGRWFLVLTQPSDRPPVRARPALVGLEPPRQGPPSDVVRGYVERP